MCIYCDSKNETIPGNPDTSGKHKCAKMPKVVDRVFEVPLVREDVRGLMQAAFITKVGRHHEQHAVIYKGDIQNITPDTVVTIRINSACYTGDIFHDQLCDCNWQMEEAFRIIEANDGVGMLLYHFAHEGKGFGYFRKLKSFDEKSQMYPVPGDIRDFLHAVAILKDLGVKKVRVMTNNPEKQQVLRDHGIEIVETVPVVSRDSRHKEFYQYKRDVWGHALPGREDWTDGNGTSNGDGAGEETRKS